MLQIKCLWTKPTRWRVDGSEELWSLSILSVLRFHGKCTVFTDDRGKEWLKALRIPGFHESSISLLLNDLRAHDPWVWHLGKLYTNINQDKPFIQTDGDVVLGKPLPNRILGAEVCAERLYLQTPGPWFGRCQAPANWMDDWKNDNGLSFNCGLFGGNNVKAIKAIHSAGIDFVLKNLATLKRFAPRDGAAVCCEEWAIAREFDGYEVSTLTTMNEMTPHLRSVGGTMGKSKPWAYWHLSGPSKWDEVNKARVRRVLSEWAPGHAEHCRLIAKGF